MKERLWHLDEERRTIAYGQIIFCNQTVMKCTFRNSGIDLPLHWHKQMNDAFRCRFKNDSIKSSYIIAWGWIVLCLLSSLSSFLFILPLLACLMKLLYAVFWSFLTDGIWIWMECKSIIFPPRRAALSFLMRLRDPESARLKAFHGECFMAAFISVNIRMNCNAWLTFGLLKRLL